MLTLKNPIVVAIDGYSSCGKSTLAKRLAKELQYTYIDSGAMYRAVTLYCLRNCLIWDGDADVNKVLEHIGKINLSFRYNEEKDRNDIFLGDENVEEKIRSIAVSDSVSNISKIAQVRHRMVELQQEMGKAKKIVMDGRDIGTVVFPDAELKLFMTASVEVRAKRRFAEYQQMGENISMEAVQNNIKLRDYIDQTRDESPLRQAADAVVLDNSNLSRDEQFEWVLNLIKEKFGK